jgi:glycerophosphoryl diester phosphodiesterase
MHVIITLLIILIVFILLVIFLIAPGKYKKSMVVPLEYRNYAHRGLHNKSKTIPENSMPAFRKAVEHGYGIELDIQFTKDKQIVVFHDDTLNRVCGIDNRVDFYTYKELKQFKLCKTNEHIPLFTDVLKLVDGKVPLIVELKNGPKNRLLCEKAYEILKTYQGDFCVESFQPLIVAWFKKNAPEILRGQLSAGPDEFKNQLTKFQAYAISRVLTNVIARPHFIAYHKKKTAWLVKLSEFLGAIPAVWTIRKNDDSAYYEKTNKMVIFEYYFPEPSYKKGSH